MNLVYIFVKAEWNLSFSAITDSMVDFFFSRAVLSGLWVPGKAVHWDPYLHNDSQE